LKFLKSRIFSKMMKTILFFYNKSLEKSDGSGLCFLNNIFITQKVGAGHRQTKRQSTRLLDQLGYALWCRWSAALCIFIILCIAICYNPIS
jgi:hypothetical protein